MLPAFADHLVISSSFYVDSANVIQRKAFHIYPADETVLDDECDGRLYVRWKHESQSKSSLRLHLAIALSGQWTKHGSQHRPKGARR